MTIDQDWVKLAMEDDMLVVNLLLHLNHSQPKTLSPAQNLDWTVRQPRSRPVLRQVEPKSKKTEGTRASPTTPLSWSGATSTSGGGADGFEESSRLANSSDGVRSKIAVKNEITTSKKRSRKKKTLAELKEEESLLLKERENLKNTLETLRSTVEKHRAENESLKKIKLGLHSPKTFKTTSISANSEDATSDRTQPQKTETSCGPTQIATGPVAKDPVAKDPGAKELDALHRPCPSNISCKLQEIGSLGNGFMLPDLNLPFDEVSGSEVIHGTS